MRRPERVKLVERNLIFDAHEWPLGIELVVNNTMIAKRTTQKNKTQKCATQNA